MVLYVGDLLYTSHSFKNNFIIYGSIFGCAGCSLLHGHALAATSQASPSSGLSSCSPWAWEHRLSSGGVQVRCSAECGISCIGRQILYHWATRSREAPPSHSFITLPKRKGLRKILLIWGKFLNKCLLLRSQLTLLPWPSILFPCIHWISQDLITSYLAPYLSRHAVCFC